MQVGELFIELGIKGADKAVDAVSSVRKTLNDVTSTSLETKAAIIGVFYELGRLTGQATQFGATMTNFSKRTDLPGDWAEKWIYLMRQGNVSTEETLQSIEGLQQAIAKIATSPTSSKGLQAIANILGPNAIDSSKLRNIPDLLNRLRGLRFHPELEADIRQMLTTSLGLGPNFAAELVKSKVDLNKIRPSDIYSGKEQSVLSQLNVDLANLGNTWSKMFGRLAIEFGPRFIKDMKDLIPAVVNLVRAFANLAESIHLMKGIGAVFHGWQLIFEEIAGIVNSLAGNDKFINGKKLGGSALQSDTARFFLKDRFGIDVAPYRAPTMANKQIQNIFNNTITANGLGSAEELAAKLHEFHMRKVDEAMRPIPQPGF